MSLRRIRNWAKFQHFKDRRPPWVKLYRDLLEDMEWFELDPKAAKALVSLWLIASEEDGCLPEMKKLAFRLRMSESECKDIISKLSHWLEQDDINAISTRYQEISVADVSGYQETETETETETEKILILTDESPRPSREPEIDLVGHKLNGHAPKTVPDCPHSEILELWAEVMPDMRQHDPSMWTAARADHLRARWRSTAVLKGWASKDEGVRYFRKLFGWCRNSDFLMGKAQSRDRRPFELELAWLVNATNWTKVHEGRFHG